MGKGSLFVVVAAMLAIGGCAAPRSSPQTSPSSGSAGVARVVDSAVSPSPDTVDEADPESVINAATLLWSGGDIDQAMSDGIFTRADLDAARAGLGDGSLDYLFD